jgi:hypothetical protein
MTILDSILEKSKPCELVYEHDLKWYADVTLHELLWIAKQPDWTLSNSTRNILSWAKYTRENDEVSQIEIIFNPPREIELQMRLAL